MFYLHTCVKEKTKPQYVIQIIVIYSNNELKCVICLSYSLLSRTITIQKLYLSETSQVIYYSIICTTFSKKHEEGRHLGHLI